MWVLKENPYCTTCAAEGLQRLAVEVDHIVPVHRGGSDNYANLAGTCKAHHKVKTASEERQRRAGT
jgi:5-methylcytosine-specific restriction protein A